MTPLVLAFALSAPCAEPTEINDGLDEVNAQRAQRGLPPFQRDRNLTLAAHGAASYRASYRMFGHTSNDFQFLPPGAKADAAGCAAYPPQDGWLSCCVNDRATYAGAAWVMGSDGRRFMHLFVSNTASAPVDPKTVVPQPMSPPPTVVVQSAPCAQAAPACQSSQRVRLFQRERVVIRTRLFSRTGCR